jgi:hypothetical protein
MHYNTKYIISNNEKIFKFIKYKKNTNKMKKFEVVKIFFIALITGNIMGIILIQIFRNLTIKNVIIMEVVLISIIIILFITTKLWNKRQDKMKKSDNQQPTSDKRI